MSSKLTDEQKSDQKLPKDVGESSNGTTGMMHRVEANREANRTGADATNNTQDSEGEDEKVEQWSTNPQPQTSFRRADDEISAADSTPNAIKEATGDESCLSQIGAMFSPNTASEEDQTQSHQRQQKENASTSTAVSGQPVRDV